MTAKVFRAFALSLPEAVELPHFERASFRVGKKIFATLTGDGTEVMVRVTPRQRVYELIENHPDVFFSYGGWTERNGALGTRLGTVDAELMRELVTDAWRRVASQRARSAFAALARR